MKRPRSGRRTARRRAATIAGVTVAIVVLLLAVAGLAVAGLVTSFARGALIARNVTVGGLAVGGMGPEQARSTLERGLLPLMQHEVTLAYPGGGLKFTREQLGLSCDLEAALTAARAVGREPALLKRVATHWRLRRQGVDLPAPLSVDQTRLQAALAAVAPQVNREPLDAKISVNDSNVLQKTPGQSGVVLLVPDTAQALARDLQNPQATEVDLVVKEQPPNISAEDLAGLQMVLAAYSTPYHTWQRDRTHNMALAIGEVNGTVLKPGEEFSLNETVGERTVAGGYRSAPIFRDGKVVPDTGGGICQVASTLYNTGLLANLDILQRDHHSRPVWYCKTGRDAAVYWGSKNLRFRNSLKHTIVILGEVRGDRLWSAVVGHAEDDYDVDLTVTNLSTWGSNTKTIEDPSLPPGKRVVENPGCGGARATLWMTVSQNGRQIKKVKLHDDYYSAVTRVVRVGKAEPAVPEPGVPTTGGAEAGTTPGPELAPAPDTPPPAETKPPPAPSPPHPPPDRPAHCAPSWLSFTPRPKPAATAAFRGG